MSWGLALQRFVDLAISLGSRAVIDSTLYSRGSSSALTCPVCPACAVTCPSHSCPACPACSATCPACSADHLGVLLPWTLFALVFGILAGGLIGVRSGWTFRAFLYPHQIIDVPDLEEVPEPSAPVSEETASSEAKGDGRGWALSVLEKDSGRIQSAGARAAIAAARRRRQLTE